MVPMGTMRERTPGTWELVVSAGLDPTTGRYRREIRRIKTTSKREAKAALAELETAVAAGRVSSDDPTLGQLLERSAAMLPAVSIGVALCCPLPTGFHRHPLADPLARRVSTLAAATPSTWFTIRVIICA